MYGSGNSQSYKEVDSDMTTSQAIVQWVILVYALSAWAGDKSWGCLLPAEKVAKSFYWICISNVNLEGGSQLPLKNHLADLLGFKWREESELLEEELQHWDPWAHFIFKAMPWRAAEGGRILLWDTCMDSWILGSLKAVGDESSSWCSHCSSSGGMTLPNIGKNAWRSLDKRTRGVSPTPSVVTRARLPAWLHKGPPWVWEPGNAATLGQIVVL